MYIVTDFPSLELIKTSPHTFTYFFFGGECLGSTLLANFNYEIQL